MNSQKKSKRKPAKQARVKFDEQLFERKLSDGLSDLPVNSVDALFRVAVQGFDQTPRYFVQTQIAMLRERRLVEVDRIAREVWQVEQRKKTTPDFIRKILIPKAMEQVSLIEGYIGEFRATGSISWEPELEYLASELAKVKSEIVSRYARDAEDVTPRSSIGRNINKLRNECGWTFDQLSGKTTLDKKLILSHVNKGTKPTASTKKIYADTFTKYLERKVTVEELES